MSGAWLKIRCVEIWVAERLDRHTVR